MLRRHIVDCHRPTESGNFERSTSATKEGFCGKPVISMRGPRSSLSRDLVPMEIYHARAELPARDTELGWQLSGGANQ
jgi:hypothetical protein